MRDQFLIHENGEMQLVSDLPTSLIQECLQEELISCHSKITIDDIKMRLEIELIARKIENRL
jgi:hypothetical protein